MAADRAIDIRGADDLVKKLAALGPRAMQMAAQALYQEATVVKAKAFKLCPKDTNRGGTGHLRNSIWVDRPVIDGPDISVSIHAGGGDAAPYAIAVHEHLSEHSPYSWRVAESQGGINWSVPGTGPKFLERPVLEAQRDMASLIARRLDMQTMVR